jgi:hypothetical protein
MSTNQIKPRQTHKVAQRQDSEANQQYNDYTPADSASCGGEMKPTGV